MNETDSNMAANSIAHEAEQAGFAIRCAAAEYERHSVIFRPKIYIDGNQWCVLYGDNLQDGVAGFGDSPAKAMEDFDINFNTALKKTSHK